MKTKADFDNPAVYLETLLLKPLKLAVGAGGQQNRTKQHNHKIKLEAAAEAESYNFSDHKPTLTSTLYRVVLRTLADNDNDDNDEIPTFLSTILSKPTIRPSQHFTNSSVVETEGACQ